MAEQKYNKQNLIFLVESSSNEVPGPSEVPWFVGKLIFRGPIGSQASVWVLDNRVLAGRLSTSEKRKLVRNNNFEKSSNI